MLGLVVLGPGVSHWQPLHHCLISCDRLLMFGALGLDVLGLVVLIFGVSHRRDLQGVMECLPEFKAVLEVKSSKRL